LSRKRRGRKQNPVDRSLLASCRNRRPVEKVKIPRSGRRQWFWEMRKLFVT